MLGDLSQQDKVIGTKQVLKALDQSKATRVYLALDVDAHLRKKIEDACAASAVECVQVPSMAHLGQVCGIDVGAACAAVIH